MTRAIASPCADRLLDDLDHHDLARLRIAALVGRHEEVLVDALFSASTNQTPRSSWIRPTISRFARAEHLDDLALGTAAPVGARDARRDAIAVEHLVHFARRQEQVGTARVGHQEAEAVGMPLYGAGDEVELRGEADLAFAVAQRVAALHQLVDACGERLEIASAHLQPCRELGQREWDACLVQRVEDLAAARQLIAAIGVALLA